MRNHDFRQDVSQIEADICQELEVLERLGPILWQDSVLYYLFGTTPAKQQLFSDNLLL